MINEDFPSFYSPAPLPPFLLYLSFFVVSSKAVRCVSALHLPISSGSDVLRRPLLLSLPSVSSLVSERVTEGEDLSVVFPNSRPTAGASATASGVTTTAASSATREILGDFDPFLEMADAREIASATNGEAVAVVVADAAAAGSL